MKNTKPIFIDISKWADIKPQDVAVDYCGSTLTYSELEYRSNMLAQYLILRYPAHQKGNVAVYLEPGLMVPVVLLAILKSGFAYIPLSDFQPKERINKILADSSAFLVISTEKLIKDKKIDTLYTPSLILENVDFNKIDVCNRLPEVSINDLAYILYTSGSTGIPKGVAIEHENLSYYLDCFNNDLWSETKSILPLTSSLSFAAAVAQLYAPLLRGDTLYILPKNILNKPEEICSWYQKHSNASIYCVPTVWDEILQYVKNNSAYNYLPKTIFLSGESVPFELKERTFSQIPGVRIFNLYGPTEATANGSFSELEILKPVTLGKALSGSEICILDRNNLPVSDGEVGEICIVGKGVARGYLHNEELNAQRFFDSDKGRGHRTGDLGKFNLDGDLIYMGRMDRQIKIHGVRIDPGEIEGILIQHPDMKKVVVRAISSSHGKLKLVAYLITKDKSPTVNEIRDFMKLRIPQSMMPNHFAYIDKLPKLPNGKLDEGRLPLPNLERPELSYPLSKPSNDIERELVDIWQQVLNFSDLGVDDNFFDLGGTSLQATKVRQMIRQYLFCTIDYEMFFNNPTPRQLALIIPYYVNDESFIGADFASVNSDSLLSSQQYYFLTLDQISMSPAAYQIAFKISATGSVNVDALEWCIRKVLKYNPVLRTRFNLGEISCTEGGYSIDSVFMTQQSLEHLTTPLDDLNDCQLLSLTEKQVISLDREPPLAIQLLTRNNQEYMLLFKMHHAVFDHDSIAIVFNQFISYYRDYLAGDRSNEPSIKYQYTGYSQWQNNALKHSLYPQEMDFWMESFYDYLRKGADASMFPERVDCIGGNYKIELPDELTQEIRSFSRKHNTTPFVFMLTVFNFLLNSETAYHNIPIGIPVSNRMLYENSSLVGCFVNMITYYDCINPSDDIVTLLEHSKKRVYSILDNQSLPYIDLVREARAKGIYSKLRFPICFNYLSEVTSGIDIDGCTFNYRHIDNNYARFDLMLSVAEGSSMSININYIKDCFSDTEVRILSDKYISILSGVI
ncbi:AMP-binding protein [Dongshaea marina]|uniref:AMP-binding protein n=1 Tax=Dongshaea marina TaxID=2047966 RepID=UPI000D3E884F|nr:AMP-binding protein [Dongshaea marina]